MTAPRTKIVATVGPASAEPAQLRALVEAGATVFRLNMSHGEHDRHAAVVATLRALEREFDCPLGIVLDLQGPKIRLGRFRGGSIEVAAGDRLWLDQDPGPGDRERAPLLHPEVFAAVAPGARLLVDDGRVALRVETIEPRRMRVRVEKGGRLSDNKGVNLPSVTLPISALTAKDRRDLRFGLDQGVDWVALSFVQRATDIDDLRMLIGGRAGIIAKLEKPAAIAALEEIVEAADAVMVARGDLGVELPPEAVPVVQKRIVRACRQRGRPVIIATQMLDSMITAAVPTRAEASDVATAVYEGVDAVMLSAETAVGHDPAAAVSMMARIIREVESDPFYRSVLDAAHPGAEPTEADAICCSVRRIAQLLPIACSVTCTESGYTTLRVARERPASPILSLTPTQAIARRLALAWGVESRAVTRMDGATVADAAVAVAQRLGLAGAGDTLVLTAGLPFGQSGTTNQLRILKVEPYAAA